ncbi:hypothetical protein T484DRAFT_1961039 [Baffinella frigidus]|nr:hypothetical protein T484DRAFT_1961039 [Cryptophyta sp. CCMP2293]
MKSEYVHPPRSYEPCPSGSPPARVSRASPVRYTPHTHFRKSHSTPVIAAPDPKGISRLFCRTRSSVRLWWELKDP